MAFILYRHIDDRVEIGEVPGPLLRIGRGTEAHLRFGDTAVALNHASIHQEEGYYVLTDHNSVTGTYVNGKRIQSARLADGDEIEIGTFRMRVRLSGLEGSLSLDIRPVVISTRPKQVSMETPRLDYVRAYSLDRKFLNKTVLTLLFTLGVIALLGSLLQVGKNHVFRPGSVSVAHALFANQCARCHEAWKGPSEKACKECHEVPLHHKQETFTPSCPSCHVEHREQQQLANIADQQCVICHGNLQTKDGKPSTYEKKVTDFTSDHPEFAIMVKDGSDQKRLRLDDTIARQSDFSKIKLNHQVHLKPDLKSPKGPVQLICNDCHKVASDGLRMAPVTYQEHCKECHELGFDSQFPNRIVPHGSPEEVHAYLLMVFAERRGEMLPEPERSGRLLSPSPSPTRLTLTPWMTKKVFEAETHLYKTTCPECHELKDDRPFPKVEKTAIPTVWLPHARFKHKTHHQLRCISCHQDVPKSTQTTDVLLPGIQTCRECHRTSKRLALLEQDRARSDCVACHYYHDPSKWSHWDGRFTVRHLLSGADPEKTKK